MDDGRLDALGQTIVSALPGAATEHRVAFNQLAVIERLRDPPTEWSREWNAIIGIGGWKYDPRENRESARSRLTFGCIPTRRGRAGRSRSVYCECCAVVFAH